MYLVVTQIFIFLILCSLPAASGSLCGPPPVVTNSSWTLPCVGDKNELCHFVCDWGFKANGLTFTHCKDDGHWSDPGKCSTNQCGDLPAIDNGGWKRYCKRNYGASCDLACNDGYIAHGATSVQCLFDGVNTYWSAHGGCVEIPHISVGPPRVIEGEAFSVFCDADLAKVPKKAQGILSIALSWKYQNLPLASLAFSQEGPYVVFPLRLQTPVTWYYDKQELVGANENSLIGRETYKIKITVPYAKTQHDGKYCCDVKYYDRHSKIEVTQSCQNVRVGNKAIVHPSVVAPGKSVTASCDADLAGVPIEASGLEYLMLTWTSQNIDPNDMLIYDISVDPRNKTNTHTHLNKPSGKHNWDYVMDGARLTLNNARVAKDSVTIGVFISEFQAADSGWFCCGAAYFDTLDERRYEYGCQLLSVDETRVRFVQLHSKPGKYIFVLYAAIAFLLVSLLVACK